MKQYLNIEAEEKLANNIYYNGGTVKFEGGGETPPLTPEQQAEADKAESARKDKRNANIGMGLNIAGAAVDALDDDPDYGNADVASSTLKFAAMGAMAGPIGAAVGGAVGLGVGLIQKNKFEKAEKKAKYKAEQKEGYDSAMKDLSEFGAYADGGVINKYEDGGKVTDPPKDKVKPNTNYLNADGTLNLNTTDPLASVSSSGTLKEDKGLWDEDASITDNARNIFNKGVDAVQYASLRPGGGHGRRNIVATGLSEMSAIPSINRIIKKGGDLEQISDDPTNVGAWTHLGLNALAAVPGASMASSALRMGSRKSLPFLKGTYTAASKYMKSHPKVANIASVLEGGAMLRQGLHATEKILHTGHRIEENRKAMSGDYDYQTGGMTKGSYSHSTNPLTVVDKNGKNTGMELTGGEGVFDKPFMGKLKGMLASGNYQEAGKAVQMEMKTWKQK